MPTEPDKWADDPTGVYYRTFPPDESNMNMRLVETVASLKGVDETDLAALYPRIRDLADSLCTSPPFRDAHVQIEFTYENYRITLFQDGHAVFRRVSKECTYTEKEDGPY